MPKLRLGLNRFNRYLIKTYGQEIVDIDSYYWQAYNRVLMGDSEEKNAVRNCVAQLFESTNKAPKYSDVRKFLINLQGLQGKQTEGQTSSIDELHKLIKPSSFSKKLKSSVKSPYITVLVTTITTASLLMEIIQRLQDVVHP